MKNSDRCCRINGEGKSMMEVIMKKAEVKSFGKPDEE
jgi:hypothetical protein